MIQPSVKLPGPVSGRSICRIIYNPRVICSNTGSMVYNRTSSYDTVPLALSKSEASGTGNKINFDFFAISPDGQWIASLDINERSVDIWNVETRSYARTIAKKFQHYYYRITYSADGKKIMFIGTSHSGLYVYVIWDVTTDAFVMELQLEVSTNYKVANSPNGSKIAVADRSYIQIIDVSTGKSIGRSTITPYANDETCYLTNQFIWSPNGHFLVSVIEDRPITKSEIYLLLFGGSIKLLNPCMASGKRIIDLACSPNSLTVAAIYGNAIGVNPEKTLSISCTRTGNLIRTTSFTLTSGEVRIAFTSEEDILICGYDSGRKANVLLRFNVVPTHFIQINTQFPLNVHPSETPFTIEYSLDTSRAIIDYASQVDADGWILNAQGKRQMWTPWANYELSCSCKPPQEGQTKYRTMDVRDPETRGVVLRYVIAFEQPGDANQVQEKSASVE